MNPARLPLVLSAILLCWPLAEAAAQEPAETLLLTGARVLDARGEGYLAGLAQVSSSPTGSADVRRLFHSGLALLR